MWLLRNYESWLEFVRDLLSHPSPEFPWPQVQCQLANTLDTLVSWNWEDRDGAFGAVLSHPIEGWPSEEDAERWRNGLRDIHPLLCWFRETEDPRPMTLDRVPDRFIAPGAMELTREATAKVCIEQQLSIPCYADRNGHRAFVAAKDGDDFGDEALQLARRIQPLLALLWLQSSALERCPRPDEAHGLTGRELAVLQLLADGLTAGAIAHRLAISPRTVHSHLAHLYRKLGVSDRMRAVLVAESARLIDVDLAPGRSVDLRR